MNFNRFWIDVCDQRMSVTETGPFKSMAQRVQVHRYIMIDTLLVQCHVTTVIVINENGFGELSIYLILGAFLSHLCIWLVSLPSHSFTHSFIRSFIIRLMCSSLYFGKLLFFINQTTKRCFCLTIWLFSGRNWARHVHTVWLHAHKKVCINIEQTELCTWAINQYRFHANLRSMTGWLTDWLR